MAHPGPLARHLALTRIALALHPGYGAGPVSVLRESRRKNSNLQKFDFGACVARPGRTQPVSLVASNAGGAEPGQERMGCVV